MIDREFPFNLPAPPVDGEDLKISFEFFPPKSEKMAETLWQSVQRLEPLSPRFVSVTYGASGSTRERTHSTVNRINAETSLSAAAHLTCVGATREEVNAVAEAYWQAGIKHIVALRGDPPDDNPYQPHPGGYDYAADLVAGLQKGHRGVVIDRLGVNRSNEADLIGDAADVRKQFGHPGAALPALWKSILRRRDRQAFLVLGETGQALPHAHAVREILLKPGAQLRLVVIEIHLRRAA